MMNLSEYRKRPALLADYLPWAALVAKGVVLNKDGSFQRTARFRGPDLDSATPAELIGTTVRLNNALRRLGSGWAIFVEAQRDAANRYPESRFPDAVSALVDAERKAPLLARAQPKEVQVELPFMSPAQHVAEDYRTTSLSLKAHPVGFFRAELDRLAHIGRRIGVGADA